MSVAVSKVELTKEQKYLTETRKIIKSQIEASQSKVNEDVEDINDIKKYVWKRMSSYNDTMDTIEYSFYLNETRTKGTTVKGTIKNIVALKKAYNNAYFGRITFNSEKVNNDIYIGLTTVVKDNDFYVYDWRSPIASLFYNYGLGKASYDAPGGTVEGEILLKRQYKIKGENILRCFDNDINIDDDYLQEILASSSSEKMTPIVNTIQIEQNKIIRNEKDKYLITQGIAGSGKTSVGLHRIAYLLYKNKNMNSNNVLIFSPNEVFSNYISDVLPELGEENVLQTTFSAFSENYLPEFKKIESFYNFIEKVYSNEQDNVFGYKFSNDIINVLDKYIWKFKNELHFKNSFKIKGMPFDKKHITNLFVEKYENLPINERLDKLSEHLCDYIGIKLKKYQSTIRENLTNILSHNLNIIDIYNGFLDYLKDEKIINDVNYIDENILNYEDLVLVLYLKFELFGYPYDEKIIQILIDEAQDYSVLQFKILKKIFVSADFTILGDINQNIHPYYKYESLEKLKEIFNKNYKYIELTKSYRSTYEIIEYTNKILDIKNVSAIRNKGNQEVEIKKINSKDIIKILINDIKQIYKTKNKKIAIITKNLIDAKKIYNKIKNEFENISLVTNSEKEKIKEIAIIPSYLSKGLEFDAVIICNNEEDYYKEFEKRLFYVACTRAQHRLIIYNNFI